MAGCVFCEILAGRRPGAFIYRDEHVAAIMDTNQASRGHSLVLPCQHIELIGDMAEELGMHLFRVAMRLDRATRESELHPDGIRLVLRDGRAAGQEVPHLHLHIIPFYHGWAPTAGIRRVAPQEELERTAALIARAYTRLFG